MYCKVGGSVAQRLKACLVGFPGGSFVIGTTRQGKHPAHGSLGT